MATPEVIATGVLTDGAIKLDDRASFVQELKALEHGSIVMTVRHASAAVIRSQKASRYYWGVVLRILSEETGHSAEDIHDAMCERFLPNEQKRVEFFNRMTGESLTVDTDHRRTSKLSGAPFYDFVENVRQFGREFLGVDTPDPNHEYWRKAA